MKTNNIYVSHFGFKPVRESGEFFKEWKAREWKSNLSDLELDDVIFYMALMDHADADRMELAFTMTDKDSGAEAQEYYVLKSLDGDFNRSYVLIPNDAKKEINVFMFNGVSVEEDFFEVELGTYTVNLFEAYRYWNICIRDEDGVVGNDSFKEFVKKTKDFSAIAE